MLELRDHQLDVVQRLREGFAAGHQCQLMYAPTGFGKTEAAIHIMQQTAEKYNRSSFVVDRIVLAEQTSLRLGKYDIDHGVMQSGHWRWKPAQRIQVCSAQTLEKRKSFPDTTLMMIDEAHIQRASLVKYIRENPQVKVIGLTATPFTKGLGQIYTNVVGGLPTSKLVEQGWLAPLKVFIAKEINMDGAKKVAGEWSSAETTKRGMEITGDVVSEWVKKTHEIYGGPRKTIVFCSGVNHGRDLELQFKAAGHNFVSISYKEDDDFKRITIEEFAKPNSEIMGLIATDILTRGFDVSDVMIGVSARPFSKSFSSHVQQLGRVMRPHPGKEFGLWLDHSGNYLRFADDWDELYANGVTELDDEGEKAKKEPTEKKKKDAKCQKCGALWVWPGDKCGNCGHIQTRPSMIVTVPGEMMEYSGSKVPSGEKQEVYSQLLHYARTRGFRDGWAAHQYKTKFGVWPRNLAEVPQTPTPQILSWIRSRQIAYAKSRAA